MDLAFVYNPKSGSGISKKEITLLCKETGHTPIEFVPLDERFDAKMKRIAKRKNAKIAVIGGDGTISSVARHIVDTGNVLVPLPGGTFNNFTKDLGVPQDLKEALARITSIKATKIDVAKVNDKVFINNSSLGLYPLSLRKREQSEKRIGKWQATIRASFKVLINFKIYDVTVNGESFHTPFIFVGNNRYSLASGGIPERTKIDKGELTVLIAKTSKRWELIKMFLFALLGKSDLVEDFEERHVSSIKVVTKKSRVSISHDGEVSKLSTPLKYTIKPKSLKVIC